MNDEFKWIEKVERGELSLVGLINANRQMEEEMGKRRRIMWIVQGVLAVIALVLAAYVVFGLADCHDDTQAKLYDFALQNRILFGFEGA